MTRLQLKPLLASLILAFGLHGLPVAAEVDPDRVEALGFSPQRLGKIDDFVRRDIAAQKIPGAVTLVPGTVNWCTLSPRARWAWTTRDQWPSTPCSGSTP